MGLMGKGDYRRVGWRWGKGQMAQLGGGDRVVLGVGAVDSSRGLGMTLKQMIGLSEGKRGTDGKRIAGKGISLAREK